MVIYYSHENLGISPVGLEDLDILRDHRNDFETWSHLTTIMPLTSVGQVAWFKSLGLDSKRQYFILSSGAKLGMVRMDEVDRANRSCRVGIDIFKKYRRLGLSYVGWELILKYCFYELGMNRVWLLVIENNSVAIRVYDKLGFKREGVMRKAIYRGGVFLDYVMFSILKEEYDSTV